MRAVTVLLNDRAAYDAARAAAAPRSRPRLGCIDADRNERLIMFQLFFAYVMTCYYIWIVRNSNVKLSFFM